MPTAGNSGGAESGPAQDPAWPEADNDSGEETAATGEAAGSGDDDPGEAGHAADAADAPAVEQASPEQVGPEEPQPEAEPMRDVETETEGAAGGGTEPAADTASEAAGGAAEPPEPDGGDEPDADGPVADTGEETCGAAEQEAAADPETRQEGDGPERGGVEPAGSEQETGTASEGETADAATEADAAADANRATDSGPVAAGDVAQPEAVTESTDPGGHAADAADVAEPVDAVPAAPEGGDREASEPAEPERSEPTTAAQQVCESEEPEAVPEVPESAEPEPAEPEPEPAATEAATPDLAEASEPAEPEPSRAESDEPGPAEPVEAPVVAASEPADQEPADSEPERDEREPGPEPADGGKDRQPTGDVAAATRDEATPEAVVWPAAIPEWPSEDTDPVPADRASPREPDSPPEPPAVADEATESVPAPVSRRAASPEVAWPTVDPERAESPDETEASGGDDTERETGPEPTEPSPEADRPSERTQLLRAAPPAEEPRSSEETQLLPVVRPDRGPTVELPRPPAAPPRETRPPRAGPPSRAERTEIIDLAELGELDAPVAPTGPTEPLARPRPQGAGEDSGGPAYAGVPYADVPTQEPPGPTAGSDGGGAGRPPRRRGRRALLAASVLVVVVAVAAGVVFWVPGVATRLGLREIDAGTPPPAPSRAAPTVRPVGTSAPAPTTSGVASRLAAPAANPALGKLTGVVLDAASGTGLWQRDPSRPLAPGSANKLLTGAAALLALDHDERLSTRVVAGRQPGTAVLAAGGDPTLSSLPAGKDSVYWNAAHLSDLIAQVKRNSHGTIHTVYIDQSRYSGPPQAPGWTPTDIDAGNWAPIVPAMLDGGRHDPTKAEGSPRSHNPGGDLLQRFAQGIGAGAAGNRKAPEGAKVLGVVQSAPVDELVANTLTISDNVLAEALGREVARSQGLPESFAGAHKAVLKVLSANGFDVSGTTLADSSGLSTKDRIPARLLAAVVRAAAAPAGGGPRVEKLRPLLDGLPVAGGTGSLADRFRDATSSAGDGWVRAKTGTLSTVSTLTGIVTDSDGRVLVFAFMSNESTPAAARPALDAMAAALRGCGCRG